VVDAVVTKTERLLPVVDMTALRSDPKGGESEAVIEALRRACRDRGFFSLVGHGVDVARTAEVLASARAFFALPLEEKLAIENIRSAQFRGYTRVGQEQTNGHPDLREQLDVGVDRTARDRRADGPSYWGLIGPNQWPAALPALRPALLAWQAQIDQLGRTLLRAVARALGQPVERLTDWVTPTGEETIKLIRYPAPEPGENDQGVGTHRDYGQLTFVLQDNVAGLQVERDGQLLEVPPLPGAFVVNLGEMLQLLTNGYFKATVHRVVSPPIGVQRCSIIYFFNPRLDATLTPLPLPAELAPRAPGGHSTDPTNPILASYGDNILKVRLRAHPDVAQRHHHDLLHPNTIKPPTRPDPSR
jgi:isopenicillin N synthase-like dioxygenase